MGISVQKAFEIFSAFPEGLAVFEFVELMDDALDRRNASARLSQFVYEGLAQKAGHRINPRTGQNCTVYAATGKAFSERDMTPRHPARKRKRPTDSELIELRRWKHDAIARFPELGVDPIVLKARQQVAEILRKEGAEAKAALVERGELDDGETMRIVLSILRPAN